MNARLKLFWMGRGKTENVGRRQSVFEGARREGIKHVLHLSDFGHSWITWRRDLYFEVAPKLFR